MESRKVESGSAQRRESIIAKFRYYSVIGINSIKSRATVRASWRGPVMRPDSDCIESRLPYLALPDMFSPPPDPNAVQ